MPFPSLEPPPDEFAAILYAEPGALGIIANIIAGLVVAVENMLNPPFTNLSLYLAGIHLIVCGGLLQLVSGFLCFRRNDHLTGTAFVVFAALWTVMGVNHLLTPQMEPLVLSRGILPGMLGFMGVSVVLCLCAVTVNYLMPPVLIAILLALIFEAVGAFFLWGHRVAAAFELIIVISGFYAVIVMTLKGVSQRYILPGFGNAIFDPLLVRTVAGTSARRIERKKNTIYGEPMGLGYLGNVVPATVLIFHHLGYFQDFRPAMAMFISTLFCHILASYYAFLRHDFFHAVQFVVYFVFWMSRGILQLLLTMDGFGQDALTQRVNYYGQWSVVILLMIVTLSSIIMARAVFFYNLYFVVVAIMSVDNIPINAHNFTFGVPAVILALISLYLGMAHLENSIAEKPVMWLGGELLHEAKLEDFFNGIFDRFRSQEAKKGDYTTEEVMDNKAVDCVAFVASAVALLALSPMEATNHVLPIPWVLTAGIFLHLYAARLAYAAGSLAKAYVMVVLALFWIIWAVFLLNQNFAVNMRFVSIAVLCMFTVAMAISPTFTRVWIVFALFMELCIIAQIVTIFNNKAPWMILVTSLLAALVSLYAAFAEIVNTTIMGDCIPTGEPILKEKLLDDGGDPCLLLSSRRSSNLRKVARLLDEGKVVGVPTDTVYALGASCKHPESISQLFHVKGRPPEKPICICLSNLDQLAEADPPFSPLLWNFMRRCYPGGISCVVPKGEWLKRLGLGEAVNYVGTEESICIRVPDSSVLCYIVSLHGPIALTSANLSGGPDSTHHSMVVTTLGDKLDAIVCDGDSNETQASTVVNCCKIDEGVISYFREGCTPTEYVNQLFEDAKNETNSKSTRLDIRDITNPEKSKSL